MPKCVPDADLLSQLQLFMSDHELTVCGTAAKLGVDRSTLWRFCQTAMAREDTKARYRSALSNRNAMSVSDVAVSAATPVSVQRHAASQGLLNDQELRRIRAACEGVLVLLDAYESQSLGSKI